MSIAAIQWVLNQDIKPAARKLVLIAIADISDDYGISWPSYNYLVKKTSLSRRAIIDNCTDLIATGYLQKVSRTRANESHTSNAYILNMGQGIIDDHPLSSLFKSGSANTAPPSANTAPPSANTAPPSANTAPPSANTAPPSANTAPLDPSYTLREREPLTREEFLRGIDKGYQEGIFNAEFEHLTETEIITQGSECFEAWGNDLRGRQPCTILKTWIRKGINLGMIRKAPKKTTKGVLAEKPALDLQEWQAEALNKGIFTESEMVAWVGSLEWDGNGTLYSPSKFHTQYIEQNYMPQLQRALHSDISIKFKPREQV